MRLNSYEKTYAKVQLFHVILNEKESQFRFLDEKHINQLKCKSSVFKNKKNLDLHQGFSLLINNFINE